MFRTDIEDMQKALEAGGIAIPPEKIRAIIYDLYRSNIKELEALPEKTGASIIRQYLRDWLWDIRLFLFGYVIREVCNAIKRLGGGAKPSEEIWVVSFLGHQNQPDRSDAGLVIDGGRYEKDPLGDRRFRLFFPCRRILWEAVCRCTGFIRRPPSRPAEPPGPVLGRRPHSIGTGERGARKRS